MPKWPPWPAAQLGWRERGVIAPGKVADLTLFDPERVLDRATFESPHQYPDGIPHVLVAGQFVIQDGRHTDARPGRIGRADLA